MEGLTCYILGIFWNFCDITVHLLGLGPWLPALAYGYATAYSIGIQFIVTHPVTVSWYGVYAQRLITQH